MLVRGRLVLGLGLVVLVACRFDTTGTGATGDGVPDAGPPGIDADPTAPDARPNAPDARPASDADPNAPDAEPCSWTYTPAHFDPCDPDAPDPDGPLVLSATGTYRLNTDTGVLTDPDDTVMPTPASSDVGGAHAIWVDGFIVSSAATLRVEGSKPLLVVAHGDINVFGTIDASSFFDEAAGDYARGAGADPASCPAMPPEPGRTCAQHGGSGGGAGAFGGDGGNGGEGGDGRDCGGGFPDGIPGGDGGIALPVAPTSLRGGCGGRAGAPNNKPGSTAFGAGGPGGGAVHLAARDMLSVSGTVHAGGAGGGPGTGDRSGGGGGGSGGLVGLEGATVQLTSSAVIAANGGGGGGCDGGAATRGTDGQPSLVPASGGPGEGKGEAGGNGGAGGSPDGVDAIIAERGGGGGGGGAGFVILYGPGLPLINPGAVVSPGAVVK